MAWYNSSKDFFNAVAPLTDRLDVFEALSPGAEFKVAGRPKYEEATIISSEEDGESSSHSSGSGRDNKSWRKRFAEWREDFFFPLKPDATKGDARYGWLDMPVRWFLGEHKDKFYDLALKSYNSANYPREGTEEGLAGKDAAIVATTNTFHSFRENFRIGHGPNAGNINFLAFLNPFNYARALDNFFINNGLRMLAFARNADNDLSDPNEAWGLGARGFMGILGIAFCAVGAVLRLPRVFVQYAVGATTKPLWNLYKEYKINPNQQINWWLAIPLAVLLTMVNMVIIGVTVGGAAPAVSYVSNVASEAIIGVASKTVSTITATAVSEVLIRPVAQGINQQIITNLPTAMLPNAYLGVFPGTDAVVAGVVGSAVATPVRPLITRGYIAKHQDKGAKADDKYEDYGYRSGPICGR